VYFTAGRPGALEHGAKAAPFDDQEMGNQ